MMDKLKGCTTSLSNWGRKLARRFTDRINHQKRMIEIYRNASAVHEIHASRVHKEELSKQLDQEELFRKQRAKRHWLQGGDKNTKYFHASASERKRINQITKLRDDYSNWWEDKSDLNKVALRYFHQLFDMAEGQAQLDLNYINRRVADEQNAKLVTPFSLEEFTEAIYQMHPEKSP